MTLEEEIIANNKINVYMAAAKTYIENSLPPELNKFKSLIPPVKSYNNIDINKNLPLYVYNYREISGYIGHLTYEVSLDFISAENADEMIPYIKKGMKFFYFDLVTGYSSVILDNKRLHFDFRCDIHKKGED